MAKISTYPVLTNPSLSDILIGSDSNDNNATKNFSIGDMLALADDPSVLGNFVPYTGATNDVDITGNDLIADGVTAEDLISTQKIYINGILYDFNGAPGTIGQVLKSTATGVEWADENNALSYGVFYDETIQTCTTGTPVAMKFGTQVDANGVFIGNDGGGDKTLIKVNKKGVYNIQFSAQIEKSSGGSAEKIDIWFRKTGSDLAWSNTQLTLQSNSHYVVASWNIVTDLDVLQNLQIMWHQTGGNIKLISAIAQTSPVIPATPSVILTVTQVS